MNLRNKKISHKRLISFLIVVCMLCGQMIPLLPFVATAAAPSTYTDIAADSYASVTISSSGTVKYFRFIPTQTGTYRFYSSDSTGDPKAELLSSSGNSLAGNDDAVGSDFSISFKCYANTSYYIKAFMYSSRTGSYRLNVATLEIDCNHELTETSRTEASCTVDGLAVSTCSLCGERVEDVTPMLGHNYVRGICTRCGTEEPVYGAISEYNATTGDVFLGGRYIELGISRHGSFGTLTSPSKSGFHCSGQLGMIVDGDGWDFGNAPTTGDFFLPGTPEERYIFSYYLDGTKYEYIVADRNSVYQGYWQTEPRVSDQSSGSTLKAVVRGVTQHGVELEITYSFEVDDKNYKTEVRIVNKNSLAISDVRFVRSFDPDQDVSIGGSYDTYNKVLANPDRTQPGGVENYAMVVARGSRTLDGFFFVAFDNRAYASQGVDFAPGSAYMSGLWSETHSFPNFATESSIAMSLSNKNGYSYDDTGIAITFNLNTIVANGETSLEYYSSMSPNVESDLEDIISPVEPTINEIIGAEIAHDSVSEGPMIDASVASGHIIKYQWYVSAENSNVGGTAILGATDAKYIVPNRYPLGTVEYYYCVVTAQRVDNGLIATAVSDPVAVRYLGNTHEFEEVSRINASCTADGRINYVCSCGATKTGIIPALGHSISTTVVTQATCTTDGLIVDRCTNAGCNYEKRTVVHGSHSYSVSDRKEATCNAAGYVEYTCAKCSDKKYEYFEGKHNYVESERVEPQIGVEGRVTYTCSSCRDSYSIVIPELTPVLKNSSVLLIQDNLPWAEDVNTSLLKALKTRGVVSSYNIINTNALATTDLTQYGVVFIANDQSTSMYNRLAANADKLEAYVRAGGNLIYGACDQGWGGGGSNSHSLPGGVTTSNYYSVYNYIVNELHPIVTGVNTDNRSLRDELLKGNYCSHTYFNKSTLPAGTDIILRDANGNPTLIEYKIGDGTVIASGLTWEYFYVREHYGMVTNYSKYAYDDLVTYMVYMSNTCEHDYEIAETVDPTCEENGYTKYVCIHCSHEYMGDIVIAEGHDHVESSRTNASCTNNGEIVYTCSCGDRKTEVIASLGHSWKFESRTDATCGEYGEIVYKCESCGEEKAELIAPTQHDYQVTKTVEPTCTTDGYIEFSCLSDGCRETKRQTLDRLGHTYGGDNVCDRCGHTIIIHTHDYTVKVVAPTCTAMGYTEYTCSCGHSYRDSYLEPVRHSWGEGVVTSEATCTSDGITTYTCSVCSAIKTSVTVAGHKWSESVTVNKTCTSDGAKTKTCSACGEVETEIIPAGHEWNEGLVITAASCTKEGSKLCGCTVCGYTETFTVPALGHTYVNGVCTRCGGKFIDNIMPSEHPLYGMYFEIDDILSDYGPSLIDEYGLLLDYNKDANLEKVAVYLTQDGTMWRRCIAVKGTNIQYATYVPYLSYRSEIKYTGLNHNWINIFRLSENDKGVWCYSDFATIGVNLQDAYGNLLLSLYDIGQAGAETRIFDNLDEMKAWLYDECLEHNSSDWIVDEEATCVAGSRHKECTICKAVLETEEIPATADHTESTWIVDKEATCEAGSQHKECTVCKKLLETEEIRPTEDHKASDWIVDENPTATESGSKHKECTVCHAVLETEEIPATGIVTGDVDNDGFVTVVDVIVLRRYLAGGYDVEVNASASDINKDGKITDADVDLLRRTLVG